MTIWRSEVHSLGYYPFISERNIQSHCISETYHPLCSVLCHIIYMYVCLYMHVAISDKWLGSIVSTLYLFTNIMFTTWNNVGHQKISSLTTLTITVRKEKDRRNMVREKSVSRDVSSSPNLNLLYSGKVIQILKSVPCLYSVDNWSKLLVLPD